MPCGGSSAGLQLNSCRSSKLPTSGTGLKRVCCWRFAPARCAPRSQSNRAAKGGSSPRGSIGGGLLPGTSRECRCAREAFARLGVQAGSLACRHRRVYPAFRSLAWPLRQGAAPTSSCMQAAASAPSHRRLARFSCARAAGTGPSPWPINMRRVWAALLRSGKASRRPSAA